MEVTCAPTYASVLFVDVVGFTTYPAAYQDLILTILRRVVSEKLADHVQKNAERDREWILPTGDGMAMLFFGDEAPALRNREETRACCERQAVDAARRVQDEFDAHVSAIPQNRRTPGIRIGFHFDKVRKVKDVCDRWNYAGPAINIAKRVADLGSAGHILSTPTRISGHDQLSPKSIGNYIVKHGVVVSVFQWAAAKQIEGPERKGTVAIKNRMSAYEWGAEIFRSALSTYSMLAFPGDAQQQGKAPTIWERKYRMAIKAFARRAYAGGPREMFRAFWLEDPGISAEYKKFVSKYPGVRKLRLRQQMPVDVLVGLGCPCRGSGRRGETQGKVDRALLTFADGGSGAGLGWGIAVEMPSDEMPSDGPGVLGDLKKWFMCHVVEDTDHHTRGRRADDAPRLSEELALPEPLQRMLAMVDPSPSDVVLDLGTGKGNTALAVAPKVARVIAVDLDEGAMRSLREVIEARGIGSRVDVRCIDVTKPFPVDGGTIDIVTCRAAFHHFSDGQRVLTEVARVLRPHGRFNLMDAYFSVMARDAWNKVAKKRETDLAGFRTLDEQIAMVTAAGLEIKSVVPFLFERHLDEWLEDAPPELREPLRDEVFALPQEVLAELHFRRPPEAPGSERSGWVYAYNVFELVAVKSG